MKSQGSPIDRLAAGVSEGTLAQLGGSGGFDLGLQSSHAKMPPADHPILADLHTVWDERKFEQKRTPIEVGKIENERTFSSSLPMHVGDLPIKFPRTNYRVPKELLHLKEALDLAASFEAKVNHRLDEYYAYLTVHTSFVNPGIRQRGGNTNLLEGAHSDSVQGPRINPKQLIEHGYVITNCDPTAFYDQAFLLEGAKSDTHWLNPIFDHQKIPSNKMLIRPYHVTMFDAYCVHEPIPSEKAQMRTFCRLIYSVRKFDRISNTHNALFEYNWPMQPRPLPQGLIGQ